MSEHILSRIQNQPAFKTLVEEMRSQKASENLSLARSVRLSVAASLLDAVPGPVVYLTDRMDRALVVEDEMGFWKPSTRRLVFPEPDPLYYEDIAWSRKTRRERLRVLADLASRAIPGAPSREMPELIIAPARAVVTRTLPRRRFLKSTGVIQPAESYSLPGLASSWVRAGYQPASIVTAPGEFARRGGILDIWPPGDRFPARLEFFGDEVDMLRRFDPRTQQTIEHIQHLLVTPAREFLLPEQALEKGSGEAYSEFHIPQLYPQRATLLNYLPVSALILIEDREKLQDTLLAIDEQAESLREVHLDDGSLSPEDPRPYLDWRAFQEELAARHPLALGPLTSSDRQGLGGLFEPNPRFGGELKPFLQHLGNVLVDQVQAVVVTRQAERLQEIWGDWSSRKSAPRFIRGNLEGGWRMGAEVGPDLALFTDQEIFGWSRVQPRRHPVQQATPPEGEFIDFEEGAWVVHVDHGIGRYRGLVERVLGGAEGEYLAVEYAEGDRLFVPAAQADRLARYVGPDRREPQITRLGSTSWQRAKSRVKEEVQEVAQDLLRLYAKREKAVGHAFAPDTIWQQELEASFPYLETEDQLRVLNQVKRDMERPKPMDRLICGDVGYGKTEIALRAAFKAVMDGKQAAVLVPTTVLAQQHYDTFQERMGAFPVEIRMLSRFRTPSQQREILHGLVEGRVDIVIGTHRLLSSDVLFHDLGLLIVMRNSGSGALTKKKSNRCGPILMCSP